MAYEEGSEQPPAPTGCGVALQRWRVHVGGGELGVRTAHVPWEADYDWPRVLAYVSEFVCENAATIPRPTYMTEFADAAMALLVFDATRMEGTISPHHREGVTVQKIRRYLLDEDEPADEPWDSEGGSGSVVSADRQLFQYAQAAKFLLRDHLTAELSVDLIVRTHEIFMKGSFVSGTPGVQTPVVVGRMRVLPGESVHAGTYQFLPSRAVASAIDDLIAQYNKDSSAAGVRHPVDLATFLFYELITIHPFTNGNGRLSRLFLAWSLLKNGFPFPVSLSSGRRRGRQHYLHAINAARRPGEAGHRGELNDILILSMERTVGNYTTNCQRLSGSS